jgi:hypothetical protein
MDDEQKRKTGPPPTRRGFVAGEAISALQKAVRRSEPREALAWATELSRRRRPRSTCWPT